MTTPVALDMVCMTVASPPGVGSIPLGSALPFGGVTSFAAAGAIDGNSYYYYIQDGSNREFGFGVYTASTTSLTRNVVTASVNGVAQVTPIDATINAVVSSIQSAASLQATLTGIQNTVASDVTSLQGQINAVHAYISSTVYTSSQTITIPGTVGRVRLVGGGGGAKATAGCATAGSAGGGGGGYLEKELSGLTVGHTLALTIGAAGSATPTSGGNSSLASGTQTISTLTANGGAGASNHIGAGGSTSGGDLNVQGGDSGVAGGGNPLSFPSVITAGNSAAGQGYGGGASAVTTVGGAVQSAAGAVGVCIIDWYV